MTFLAKQARIQTKKPEALRQTSPLSVIKESDPKTHNMLDMIYQLNPALASVLNACWTQKRVVFTLTEGTLKDLYEGDANIEETPITTAKQLGSMFKGQGCLHLRGTSGGKVGQRRAATSYALQGGEFAEFGRHLIDLFGISLEHQKQVLEDETQDYLLGREQDGYASQAAVDAFAAARERKEQTQCPEPSTTEIRVNAEEEMHDSHLEDVLSDEEVMDFYLQYIQEKQPVKNGRQHSTEGRSILIWSMTTGEKLKEFAYEEGVWICGDEEFSLREMIQKIEKALFKVDRQKVAAGLREVG